VLFKGRLQICILSQGRQTAGKCCSGFLNHSSCKDTLPHAVIGNLSGYPCHGAGGYVLDACEPQLNSRVTKMEAFAMSKQRILNCGMLSALATEPIGKPMWGALNLWMPSAAP
jgi:hypothetical protein